MSEVSELKRYYSDGSVHADGPYVRYSEAQSVIDGLKEALDEIILITGFQVLENLAYSDMPYWNNCPYDAGSKQSPKMGAIHKYLTNAQAGANLPGEKK